MSKISQKIREKIKFYIFSLIRDFDVNDHLHQNFITFLWSEHKFCL